ncbi:MAG: hypothetical protein SGPRY_009421, partial [Prymnesium sp.]
MCASTPLLARWSLVDDSQLLAEIGADGKSLDAFPRSLLILVLRATPDLEIDPEVSSSNCMKRTVHHRLHKPTSADALYLLRYDLKRLEVQREVVE